jgi:hypothetical protein
MGNSTGNGAKRSNKRDHDNRADQLNPQHPAYGDSRRGAGNSKPARGNRANQLDPDHHPRKGGRGGRRG